MEWKYFKLKIKNELEQTTKEKFGNFKKSFNINSLFNKEFFENICLNELECNVDDKEFLKIDFTLYKPLIREYSYHVPLVFIEVEDNIYAEDENGHEICKLAATNAPLKVFITKYHGDWRKVGRKEEVAKFDETLIGRFSNMLSAYYENQGTSFIPYFGIIVCEIQNNIVTFYTEKWDVEKKWIILEDSFLFQYTM